nr:MAG TPA: HOLLIDAY JUNCTION RESOLVASE HOMOLOGOUS RECOMBINATION [Caudoviricetes sp.]
MPVMARTRKSAKAAGARFERVVADYLAEELDDDRIDRAPKAGAKDKGDIANVRMGGHKVVIECKDVARMDLPKWTREAQVEAENVGALVGVVVHKRHGVAKPSQQWCTLTLGDLARLLKGTQ